MFRASLCALLALTLMLPTEALAQEKPDTIPVKKEEELNKGLGPVPVSLDRSTPKRSWAALLTACNKGKWEGGMHLLNLGDLAEATIGSGLQGWLRHGIGRGGGTLGPGVGQVWAPLQ